MAQEIKIADKPTLDAIKEDTEQLLAAQLDDMSGSPGSKSLMHGTLSSGYFSFVAADDLITGDDLALEIGLSAGTAQHSDAGWFKWASQEKVLFVAKKTFRYGLSWDDIDAANAVFGGATVEIDGLAYAVRLLTGGDGDPASAEGGEWNQIMYGMHENQSPSWGVYNDQDLLTHYDYGDGSRSWCQETDADDPNRRVTRGDSGVTGFVSGSSSYSNSDRGWRPVLQLIN